MNINDYKERKHFAVDKWMVISIIAPAIIGAVVSVGLGELIKYIKKKK